MLKVGLGAALALVAWELTGDGVTESRFLDVPSFCESDTDSPDGIALIVTTDGAAFSRTLALFSAHFRLDVAFLVTATGTL